MNSETLTVIASGNNGKIREIRAALAGFPIRLTTQAEAGVSAADEPYATFIENALAKARHVSAKTNLPALADDSGLVVPALGNAPGVYSARYSGDDADDVKNNAKLLTAMENIKDRRAFYCALIVHIRHADDPAPLVAEGFWRGEITLEPRGNGGFGYDPLFYDARVGKTGAEMSLAEKQRVSHRGKSLRRLTRLLRQR